MVDLRTLTRKHDSEIRAFRRYLFTDEADSTSAIVSDTEFAKVLSGDRPGPQRFGPVNSVTDRHAALTVVADLVDQAAMLEDEQLTGSILTLSVAAHHRQLQSRLTVDPDEAAAWIRALLGDTWSAHVRAAGALSTTSTGSGAQRLTTLFFYLFIAPDGRPHNPPASFSIPTVPLEA